MGNRRFALLDSSDEEDEAPQKQQSSNSEENLHRQRMRKKMKLSDEEEEEKLDNSKENKVEKEETEALRKDDGEEEEDPMLEDAKPVGDSIKSSGKGRGRMNHYKSFEFDGTRYDLEDPVLLAPEDAGQKPYVAIIKDITQNIKDGSMMVTGQWFYRPEEAERKGGGNWQSRDTRELFYSFHRDKVPAESVLHKCVVHFVPLHKQLPIRKQHPGFIVQKVYDTVEKKLWKLTDKDYEDSKQNEIDELVNKTISRMGELLDIETEDAPADQEDQLITKRNLKKKNISPLDVTREEQNTGRNDQNPKSDTPISTKSTSEYHNILVKFDALTGDSLRDKWLEKLLHEIRYKCNSADNNRGDDKVKSGADGFNPEDKGKQRETTDGSQAKSVKGSGPFLWPDNVVPALTALEKTANDTLSSDFQKYNQKMRQMVFNLKHNSLLAERFLKGELEPSKILNMSPSELKEGLTAEETAIKEPDEGDRMQMTTARCSRCTEFKVGVRDIIQAGHGARYKLECTACGHSWYASRDEVSTLTIEAPSSAKNVGTAPWATAKFEEVEKNLVSPRESDKSSNNFLIKKTTEPYIPVLDTQKSFNKSRKEDKAESIRNAE